MAAPRLLSITPARGAAHVSTSPTIVLVFDQEIDASSVTATSLYLTNTDDHTTVAMTPSVHGDQISATPDVALSPATTYTLTVTAGISGALGTPGSRLITSPFTTGEAELTAPVITDPADDERVTALAFAWAAVEDAEQYRLQWCASRLFTGASLQTVIAYTPDYTLGEELDPGVYYVRVRAESATAVSPWSAIIAVAYQTVVTPTATAPSYADLWMPDSAGCTLVRAIPASGSMNRTPSTITLIFSSELDESSLETLPVFIGTPLIGGAPIEVTPDWAIDGDRLIGEATWAVNTTYELADLTDLTDVDGLPIVLSEPYTFTTVLSPLYVGARILRHELGELVVGYDDAALTYYCFQGSLATNARRLGVGATFDDLTTPFTGSDLTTDIYQEAILRAMQLVLQQQLTELAMQPQRETLGDYSISMSSDRALLAQRVASIDAQLRKVTGSSSIASIKAEALPSVSAGPQPQTRRSF